MFSKSTVYAISLGLIGSVSFGMTGVQAQINVTGGSMNGQAAFFVPKEITETNGILLYGANVQQLNLQTTNGNTSRAVFSPLNSQFTDVNANGLPDADDTGILQGNLSGVAFYNGSPVGFSNRPTELEFTLNSFESLLNFNGTLAAPENLNSTLFIPDPIQYEGDQGQLQLGNFGANLDGGLIALPSTYRFADGTNVSNNNNLQTSALRVKFQFRGNDVTPETGTNLDPNTPMIAGIQLYDVSKSDVSDIDSSANLQEGQLFALVQNGEVVGYVSSLGTSLGGDDTTLILTKDTDQTVLFTGTKEDLTTTLNSDLGDASFDQSQLTTPPDGVIEVPQGANGIVFIGQANEKFQVQTVGTRGTNEVKITTNNPIDVNNAALAIAIGDIYQYEPTGEFDLTQPLNYRIEGEALSAFSLLDPSLAIVSGGARRDTKFKFEQPATGARLEGRSDGFVAFAGLPGQTEFDANIAQGELFTQSSLENLDVEALINNIDPNNCTVCSLSELDPEFSTVINEAVIQQSSSLDTSGGSDSEEEEDDEDESDTDVEVIGGDNSEVGRTIYLLSLTSSDQPRIVIVLLRGDRYFVAVPDHRGRGHGRGLALGRRDRERVIVFKQIGPSSRIFPGQASIIEIEPDNLPEGFAQALQQVLTDQGLVANNITINNTTINNEVNIEGDNNEVNIDNNVNSPETENTDN
jgi:hypothetical protein